MIPTTVAASLFPKESVITTEDKDLMEQLQMYKRKAENAEMSLKKMESKLIEANQKINFLKEKEIKEAAEMAAALKVIEKKSRVHENPCRKGRKPVTILNQKLKVASQQNQYSYDPYMDPKFNEKTQFLLSMMQKIANDGQQGLNFLLQGSKDFNFLMETIKNMHKINDV
eukprot:TRINITY_DN16001_c0_g1_i1.p1 TRINITY_DN16001_c0_g1~~TRINITY_DN16001_c0_g1_i1.p1  ORF type:complete len:194 (+),score=43.13 TRINITY_DN16001_c0_g1_i1:75-584(+)